MSLLNAMLTEKKLARPECEELLKISPVKEEAAKIVHSQSFVEDMQRRLLVKR